MQEASLKGRLPCDFTTWPSGKGKTMETVNRAVSGRHGGGEKSE